MVRLEDFEVGQFVGARRRRAGADDEDGNVVRVVHRASGRRSALKRVDGGPLEEAGRLLRDLTRSAGLVPHRAWLGLHSELCFVQEYEHKFHSRPRGRCCVAMELADRSLEQEVIRRAPLGEHFGELLGLWAALLHALQAYHAQGCLHRDVSPRNVFFKDGEVKLGLPGAEAAPPAEGCYPGAACDAYSADIFAMGLLFLEMVLLHPVADLLPRGPDAMLEEIRRLGPGQFGAWLSDRCGLLGLGCIDAALVEVLGAMLAEPPWARPTADDLLDMPLLARHVDPAGVLPPCERPCVILAHRHLAEHAAVPRRQVVTVPQFHVLFSQEGAEEAAWQGYYLWCGCRYEFWWHQGAEPAAPDCEGPGGPEEEPLGGSPGPGELLAAAARQRAAGRRLAAEALCRAALAAGGGGPPAAWAALAAVLLERGSLMASRLCFLHLRSLLDEEADGLAASGPVPRGAAGEGAAAAGAAGRGAAPGPCGLCELFVAVGALEAHWASAARGVCSAGEACGAASSTTGSSQRRRGEPDGPHGPAAALRGAHAAVYLRAALAAEAGGWEEYAGLGEFYRLVGCPGPPLRKAAPHLATARSYFEQALARAPGAPFVVERLARLSAQEAAAEAASAEACHRGSP